MRDRKRGSVHSEENEEKCNRCSSFLTDGNVGMFDGSEVPEPPEIEGRIGERGIRESEVSGSGVKWVG